MNKIIFVLLLPILLAACNAGNTDQTSTAMHLQREAKDAVFIYGDTQTANIIIDNAIEMAPNVAELYMTKADFLIQELHYSEAIDNINKALELENKAEYKMLRGLTYQASSDTLAAIASLEQSIELYEKGLKKSKDKENDLYNIYFMRMTISGNKESNIAILKERAQKDDKLNEEIMQRNIVNLEKAEIQSLR